MHSGKVATATCVTPGSAPLDASTCLGFPCLLGSALQFATLVTIRYEYIPLLRAAAVSHVRKHIISGSDNEGEYGRPDPTRRSPHDGEPLLRPHARGILERLSGPR